MTYLTAPESPYYTVCRIHVSPYCAPAPPHAPTPAYISLLLRIGVIVLQISKQ